MTKHYSDLSQENKEYDGLYHPSFEHDSCGIGFVANLNGSKSRNVVQGALTMLENMEHRGGQGAEPTPGDARRGQSLVVWAIAEGRQAADAIDESLVVL